MSSPGKFITWPVNVITWPVNVITWPVNVITMAGKCHHLPVNVITSSAMLYLGAESVCHQSTKRAAAAAAKQETSATVRLRLQLLLSELSPQGAA
jgi:hypothetical protein